MTTHKAVKTAEKIDTSGLNPVQLERFFDLAKTHGLRVAKEYRKVCLTPYSAAVAKPIGSKKAGKETFRDRLRKLLNTRTEDNPLTPKEAVQLLNSSSRVIAIEMGYLHSVGELGRVNMSLTTKVKYGYWGLNKKVVVRQPSTAKRDILNFLQRGGREKALTIAKALGLSRASVYSRLQEMSEEGIVERTPKCSNRAAFYWIAGNVDHGA
jgi:hypothetical protein